LVPKIVAVGSPEALGRKEKPGTIAAPQIIEKRSAAKERKKGRKNNAGEGVRGSLRVRRG